MTPGASRIRTHFRNFRHVSRQRAGGRLLTWLAAALGLAGIAIQSAAAQQAKQTGAKQPMAVTLSAIDAHLKELESATGLDDATKTAIQKQYQQARSYLEDEQAAAADLAEYGKMIETAEAQTRQARQELATPPKPAENIADDMALSKVSTALAKRQAELDAAQKELQTLAAEPTRRQSLRA